MEQKSLWIEEREREQLTIFTVPNIGNRPDIADAKIVLLGYSVGLVKAGEI